MFRIASFLLAMIGLAAAGPASAQSLGLVNLPVVFVSQPVVQQVHHGKRIAPSARPVLASAVSRPVFAQPVAPRVEQLVPRQQMRPEIYSPVGNRLPTIDRGVRDYNGGIAQYGPFRVIDANRVALVGETDASSPRWFRVMLRRYPDLRQLDMVECPGTRDDIANMKLGRMIRAAGLATHVPQIGSVRSGAVELFFAGSVRDISDGAEFAVHSWMDDYGREADDFAEDAPQNRQYIDYYREMGMNERDARAFYAFTNSVPHRSAMWLGARDMRRWVGNAPAQIAYAN